MKNKKIDNILFVHDHKIGIYNEEYYSNGNFPPSVIERYSKYAKSFSFICRSEVITKQEASNMTKTYIQNGDFYFYSSKKTIIPLLRSYHYRSLDAHINSAELIIIRMPSILGEEVIRRINKLNCKSKLVIEVVGVLEESLKYHGSLVGKLLAKTKDNKMKKIIKNCGNTIYITEKYLQSMYPTNGKKYIVPNVYIPEEKYAYPIQQIQKNDEDKLKIGILGTLDVKYKGHHLLQKALNSLDISKNIHVEIVGKSTYENVQRFTLNNTNKNVNYNYLGSLPHDVVFNWLRSLDLLIQPSLTEGQGRVIIEAMSQGCLVLGSKVGGIVELLPEKCLFNPDDVEDLKYKIEKMIRDYTHSNKELNDIRLRNYQKSLEFSELKVLEKRDIVMNEIIEGDN